MYKKLILLSSIISLNICNTSFANITNSSSIKNIHLSFDLEKNSILNVDEVSKIYANNMFKKDLFIIESNKKYGLIDDKANIILEPKYDSIINSYNEDIFIVKDADKFFLLDKNGKNILPNHFKYLSLSKNKTFIFSKNLKEYGVIDINGKVLVEPKYQEVKVLNFFSDYYVFKLKNKYGIVNSKGNVLLKPYFSKIEHFSDDMVIFEEKDKYGIANKNGKIIVAPKYNSIKEYKNGMALVRENKKSYFINKNGHKIFNNNFNYKNEFNNGVAIFEKDSKYGLIDDKGKVLVEPKYKYIFESNKDNYLAIVQNKSVRKYGLIDKNGKVIIDFKYDYLDNFSLTDKTLFALDKKYGLIDKNGKIVLEPIYDELIFSYTSFSITKKDDKNGVVNIDGKEVVPNKYQFVDTFSNFGLSKVDLLVFKDNEKLGVLNTNNEIVLDAKYDDIQILSDNVFIVRVNSEYFFLNVENKIYKKISKKYKEVRLEKNTKYNMHTLQTLVETYAIDNKGLYPANLKLLIDEATKNKYYRQMTNYEDSTLEALSDLKSNVKGTVIYVPIKDKSGKINSYKIFGNDKDGNYLKDKSGKDFFLTNM